MEQGELGSRERESDDWMEGLLLEGGGRIRIRESNKERDNEGRSVRETEADYERARARVCACVFSPWGARASTTASARGWRETAKHCLSPQRVQAARHLLN